MGSHPHYYVLERDDDTREVLQHRYSFSHVQTKNMFHQILQLIWKN